MAVTSVRVEVGGHTTVRFFRYRRDAIAVSNVRTTQADQQHVAVRTTHGYLVRNQVSKKLFDIDGQVPDEAARDIFVV